MSTYCDFKDCYCTLSAYYDCNANKSECPKGYTHRPRPIQHIDTFRLMLDSLPNVPPLVATEAKQ